MGKVATRLLALLVLVGGLVLMRGPGDGAVADETAGLPADLAKVPVKSAMLLSLRPADLWESELAKGARAKLGKDVTVATKALVDGLGLEPAAIERLTVVVTHLRGGGDPLLLVLAKRKTEGKKLLEKLVPRGEEKKYNGQDYFASERKAAVLLGERAYAVGTTADIQSLLETAKAKGGLAPALKLASGKHAVVVAINPEAFAFLADEGPPDVEPFKPLLKASLVSLTVDLGEKLQARLGVTFPAAADAEAGAKALETARKMTLDALGVTIKVWGKDKKIGATLADLLGELEKSLKSAELSRTGAALAANVEMKVPTAGVGVMAVEAVAKVREAAMRMQSMNNLKQIGLAMHNYHDTNRAFPAQAVYDKDGKAILSWRVLLLPYLNQDALYKEFKLDEPWDSPHNKKLLAKMPELFKDPTEKAKGPHDTCYQVIVGNGAAFEGKRGIGFAGFTDGTSNTILAVETRKEVPWTKPDDVSFDPAKELPKLGGVFQNGFLSLFADGSVRFISVSINKDTLKALITRNGGEALGRDF